MGTIEPFLGRRGGRVLAAVTALVGLAYLATQTYVSTIGEIPELERAFDVDQEGTVPTAWNTLLLVLVAGVLALAGKVSPVDAQVGRRSLYVAAGVVAYLAIDEAAQLHELATIPADAILDRFDVRWLTYTWLVFGAIVAVVVGAIALRWGRSLPPFVRRRAAVALGVYLGGALVVEALNGWVYEHRDGSQFRQYVYMAGVGVEEMMEMTACVVAVTAFAALLQTERRPRMVTIRSAQ